METQFILSKYITDSSVPVDFLLKNLYDNYNILSKDYPEYNMIILYNKYDSKHKTKLEMECRSVIIDRTTLKIICYSCPTPLYNMDAVHYMWKNQSIEKNTYMCYEGSLMSLFNHNNRWFVSSRKCIYSIDSEKEGQYKMFLDVLKKDNHDMESFTKLLDCNMSYHFVLIHHENNNIVNYVKVYGENYTKLCYIFMRNTATHNEISSENTECSFLSSEIFIPEKLDEVMSSNMNKESLANLMVQPLYEGIVIKMNNMILKLQNPSFQFHRAIGSDKNMYLGFLCLYQNNTLKHFLETNISTDKFKKIVNPLNTVESFDMIGMIDALFKVITSELFSLFNILYCSDGTQKDNKLYNKLPDEYKNILFQIRGILFANIKRMRSSKNQLLEVLELKDIYNLLKSIEVRTLESFIRCRKLMLNWIRLDKTDDTKLFTSSLYHSDKIYYKLISIYTIKLFPEIMPDDLPQLNKTQSIE